MTAVADAVTVRGVTLSLHPEGDYVSDHIRRTEDFYEADILDRLRDRLNGGVLIDVGAMIGNHTAYLARFVPHLAIHAFEPVPANIALLRENVERFPRVKVHDMALSDRETALSMTFDTNLGHCAVGNGPLMVQARTLDSYGFGEVALLKIDVEGHEPEVLVGARQTIERWHPQILIEDWQQEYGALLPGYRLAASWPDQQTYLYHWDAA